MAKTKKEKEKLVEDLTKILPQIKGLVFIDYCGLKVKEINELRRMLQVQECQYLVTKKTLLRLVLKKIGWPELEIPLGGLGMVLSLENEILPAKLIWRFAQAHPKMKITGGILEQKFIFFDEIERLARLPSKEELLAQLVWQIKSPFSGLVNVFKGNLRGLVYILKQIAPK